MDPLSFLKYIVKNTKIWIINPKTNPQKFFDFQNVFIINADSYFGTKCQLFVKPDIND